MSQKIMETLNPAHIIKWSECKRIVNIICDDEESQYPDRKELDILMQSFERVMQMPLTKEMFVCEVEEPDSWNNDGLLDGDKYAKDVRDYNEQKGKVLFEGFEKTEGFLIIMDANIFYNTEDNSLMRGASIIWNPTIGDLFIEIERYNRTAAQKIVLNWAPNILPLLNLKG